MQIREKRTLSSCRELKEIITSFKRSSPRPLTNYVPNQMAHSQWANDGHTFIYEFDDAVFIVRDKGFMGDILFISDGSECIGPCMEAIHRDLRKPVVLERVIRENKDASLGSPDCILRRMSRTGLFEVPAEKSGRVEKAVPEDIPFLLEIFQSYFNPLTERIPDAAELRELIGKGGISVIRRKDGIGGMVIYERDTTNIHLRYWWVSPDSRNMGFGAALLREFFSAGQDCRRQFLWVFSDNSDAIAKYEHYGFSFDGIADEIYITK